jgi:hypothetical protein
MGAMVELDGYCTDAPLDPKTQDFDGAGNHDKNEFGNYNEEDQEIGLKTDFLIVRSFVKFCG